MLLFWSELLLLKVNIQSPLNDLTLLLFQGRQGTPEKKKSDFLKLLDDWHSDLWARLSLCSLLTAGIKADSSLCVRGGIGKGTSLEQPSRSLGLTAMLYSDLWTFSSRQPDLVSFLQELSLAYLTTFRYRGLCLAQVWSRRWGGRDFRQIHQANRRTSGQAIRLTLLWPMTVPQDCPNQTIKGQR